jgi:hypothetical protein
MHGPINLTFYNDFFLIQIMIFIVYHNFEFLFFLAIFTPLSESGFIIPCLTSLLSLLLFVVPLESEISFQQLWHWQNKTEGNKTFEYLKQKVTINVVICHCCR